MSVVEAVREVVPTTTFLNRAPLMHAVAEMEVALSSRAGLLLAAIWHSGPISELSFSQEDSIIIANELEKHGLVVLTSDRYWQLSADFASAVSVYTNPVEDDPSPEVQVQPAQSSGISGKLIRVELRYTWQLSGINLPAEKLAEIHNLANKLLAAVAKRAIASYIASCLQHLAPVAATATVSITGCVVPEGYLVIAAIIKECDPPFPDGQQRLLGIFPLCPILDRAGLCPESDDESCPFGFKPPLTDETEIDVSQIDLSRAKLVA